MKLHNVTHNHALPQRQHFCGPSAVSAITGRSAECAAAWINATTTEKHVHRRVGGTSACALGTALQHLGYTLTMEPTPRMKLRTWLRNRTPEQKRKVWLISVGCHWIVVKGYRTVCGISKKKIALSKARKLGCRIESIYEVQELLGEAARAARAKHGDPLPTISQLRKAASSGRDPESEPNQSSI